jgi:hypothetical protein
VVALVREYIVPPAEAHAPAPAEAPAPAPAEAPAPAVAAPAPAPAPAAAAVPPHAPAPAPAAAAAAPAAAAIEHAHALEYYTDARLKEIVVAVFGARQRGRPSKAGQTLEDRVRASFIRYVQTIFLVWFCMYVCQITRVFGSITTALFILSVSRYISVAVTNNLRNGVQSTIGKGFVEAQQWAQLYDDMNAHLLTQDEFFNQSGYDQHSSYFRSCLKADN